MSLKYLLIKVLVFLLLPILPVYFLSKYDNTDKLYNQDNNIVSLQNKSKFDSLDILFIGNSYCYSGIIPAYFDSIDLKTFNLGIATAGPFFYEILINDYLANCKKKPKSIFLLISPTTFSLMSDNFSAYPIHRYLENSISNEAATLKYDLYDSYLEMLQKSLKKGYNNFFLKKNVIEKKDNLFNNKGFVKVTDTCTDDIIKSTQKLYFPLANDIFSKKKFNYLLNYAAKFKSQNIEIVFFDLPTNKLQSYINPTFIEEYNKEKNNLRKQFKFISIDSSIASSSFRNIDHLNFNGAKWATRKIITSIF